MKQARCCQNLAYWRDSTRLLNLRRVCRFEDYLERSHRPGPNRLLINGRPEKNYSASSFPVKGGSRPPSKFSKPSPPLPSSPSSTIAFLAASSAPPALSSTPFKKSFATKNRTAWLTCETVKRTSRSRRFRKRDDGREGRVSAKGLCGGLRGAGVGCCFFAGRCGRLEDTS